MGAGPSIQIGPAPKSSGEANAAYIRALQLGQHASVDDVPVERRGELDQPAPSGASTAQPGQPEAQPAPEGR